MFYIYILYSERADKYYVGLTTNPLRRLEEHNNPSVNNKYTAKYIPWKMMLYFRCSQYRGEGLILFYSVLTPTLTLFYECFSVFTPERCQVSLNVQNDISYHRIKKHLLDNFDFGFFAM
jgi:hypothetical protein